MAGRFITFEGGEGAGKSTQAERLAASLRRQGRDVLVTREPGGSPLAERVRALLLTADLPPRDALADVLLFYAARADHLASVIRPALAAGTWVISDRFSDSTRAYQGAAGGIAAPVIDALDAIVVGPTQPDLTILLDLDVATGLARAGARRGAGEAVDRFEGESAAFHTALREAYLAIARGSPGRVAVIDAARPVEAIAAEVVAVVAARLGAV